MRLGLAVPLYNEEELIDAVVAELLAATAGLDARIALVNNGSRDRTSARLEALCVGQPSLVPVHLVDNAGYGGGILAGIEALLPENPPVLGWAWGDGQVDPVVLGELLAACEGGAMLAKARRVRREDGLNRRIITTGYAAVTRALGVKTPDINGCPKLLRAEAWAALSPRSRDWFLDPEVVLGAEFQGYRIAEVPVTMRSRRGGESKVRLSTIAEFAMNLAKWRFS